jgi:hypothetical protein
VRGCLGKMRQVFAALVVSFFSINPKIKPPLETFTRVAPMHPELERLVEVLACPKSSFLD